MSPATCSVALCLKNYSDRMDQLVELLASPTVNRARIVEVYRLLKGDLEQERDSLRRRESRGQLTTEEQAYLLPAVAGARSQLRPATNSNPVTARWLDAVYAARIDIEFFRDSLAR